MSEVFMAIVVFGGIFYILKMFTNYLLKRRLIKGGHIEQVGILKDGVPENQEAASYPTLKWGLVTIFAGLGLIVIQLTGLFPEFKNIEHSKPLMTFGVELVFIAAGFLTYFFIMQSRSKK